jgi:PAS domain S-box-containing protein
MDDPMEKAFSGKQETASELTAIECEQDIPLYEQRLDELNRDNETITNAIPDLLFKINNDGYFRWWNTAVSELTGLNEDELKALPLRDLIAAADHDIYESALQRVAHVERTRFDCRISIDDQEIPFNFCIVPLKDEQNEIIHMVVVGRNISDRLNAENERLSLRQKLQQAQKMESIGHLTGGIAHDFNNILTSVIGFSQLSVQRAAIHDDDKLNEYLGQVQEAGMRAKDLISQLLAFSRNQTAELNAMNLSELTQEVVTMLRPAMPSSINIDFDASNAPPLVNGNAGQLHQVIMNLCINARDAMHGQGNMQIRLEEVNQDAGYCHACHTPFAGPYLQLSISDDGDGIPEDLIDTIFEPFTSTKEVGEGTGMGLAMVHGIVHEHNGHITVKSKPGKGTCFQVFLPLAEINE